MHSKPKLALAIFTSPGAAFDEITKRRLLGTAIAIVLLTGTLAMIGAIVRIVTGEPVQFLTLAKDNPLTQFGLYLLYALALRAIVKFMGTEIDYVTTLVILGWSQLVLTLLQVILLAASITIATGNTTASWLQVVFPVTVILHVWYAVLIGIGLTTAVGIPVLRGTVAYIFVAAVAVIALTATYGQNRLSAFRGAPESIYRLGNVIVSADQMPWFFAGVVGTVVGLWMLGKELNWDKSRTTTYAVTTAFVGLFALSAYMYYYNETNYYGRAVRVYQLYSDEEYARAAQQMNSLLYINRDVATRLLDIANIYYLAKQDEKAIEYYNRFLKRVEELDVPEENKQQALAQGYTGKGAVHDIAGDYGAAVGQFEKAINTWPQYREPRIRLAVTYNRMGEYEKAIESANYAVKKLGSESAIAWVALAQAFVQTNDMKQAKTAITMATERNEELAERIGEKPEAWENAVSKLTVEDLEFPLEQQPAPPPDQEQPQKEAAAAEKKLSEDKDKS